MKARAAASSPATALFDSGAFHSYVLKKYLKGKKKRLVEVAAPYEVSMGGETFKVRHEAIINGKIEGLGFNTTVVPVEALGDADGHSLEAIIGAITMEHWEISVDPRSGSLGLEGLRRREFTDY